MGNETAPVDVQLSRGSKLRDMLYVCQDNIVSTVIVTSIVVYLVAEFSSSYTGMMSRLISAGAVGLIAGTGFWLLFRKLYSVAESLEETYWSNSKLRMHALGRLTVRQDMITNTVLGSVGAVVLTVLLVLSLVWNTFTMVLLVLMIPLFLLALCLMSCVFYARKRRK